MLGAGIQTARGLLDRGELGEAVGTSAFLMLPGHECQHPNPDFNYQPGGGPLLDIGFYYLTALFHLLGSLASAIGMARASFPTRTIQSGPRAGETIPVGVDTHIGAPLRFRSGAIASLTMSFGVQAAQLPFIEVYGAQRTLSVPDPNAFAGPVRFCPAGSEEFVDQPLGFPFAENSRGLGLSDMADAIQTGHMPRAGGDVALHIKVTMFGVFDGSVRGIMVRIESTPERPSPMPYLQ